MYIYQIMSNNFGFIDIILLAMIAGFIILRLRNILGKKTGHEAKSSSIFDEKKYTQFKPKVIKKPSTESSFKNIEKKEFLKGAEIAYESIITSFAKGEKENLKKLLTKEIYNSFEQAIDHRNRENIKSVTIKNEFLLNVKSHSNIVKLDINNTFKDYRLHKERREIKVDYN